MALTIRQGRPGEWQEILDVSHASFGKPDTYFPGGWPHTYPSPRAAEWFIVCEEAGRIVGLINQTPVTVDVGGALLKSVGIGGVCVLKEARGRGIMSAMLTASNNWQRETGTVLGFLGGDRARYRRYGYEIAGQAVDASVPANYLVDVETVPLRRLRLPDARDILRCHRRASMFVRRTEEWQRLLLRRKQYVAWGNRSGPLRAYLAASKAAPQRVAELVGDRRLLIGLLKGYLRRHKLSGASVALVPGYMPHVEVAENAAGTSACVPFQVNIFDLGRFLRETAKPLGDGFRLCGITWPVRVMYTGERASFDLELRRSGALSVAPAKKGRKPDLALDAAEWVRTFFPPPGGPMVGTAHQERLLAAFRLPLAFSAWDSV